MDRPEVEDHSLEAARIRILREILSKANALRFGLILYALCPSVSWAQEAATTLLLKTASCEFSIEPASMMVVAKPKSGGDFRVSHAVPDLGVVSDLKHDDTQVFWTLPEKKAAVSMKLVGDDLAVTVRADEPSTFTWPVIRGGEPLKALI